MDVDFLRELGDLFFRNRRQADLPTPAVEVGLQGPRLTPQGDDSDFQRLGLGFYAEGGITLFIAWLLPPTLGRGPGNRLRGLVREIHRLNEAVECRLLGAHVGLGTYQLQKPGPVAMRHDRGQQPDLLPLCRPLPAACLPGHGVGRYLVALATGAQDNRQPAGKHCHATDQPQARRCWQPVHVSLTSRGGPDWHAFLWAAKVPATIAGAP